jgi:chromodomain-helicase-DNA-binding protein 4
VHPDSRVSLRITLKKPDPSIRTASSDHEVPSASASEVEQEQEEDEEEEESEHASDEDEEADTPPARASTRLASKSTKKLPYSPRKTRANRGFYTHDEDEDEDEDEDAGSASEEERPRRTGRRTNRRDREEAEVEYSDESDDSDAYGGRRAKGKSKAKAKARVRVPVPPAIGVVCSVDDLQDDRHPKTTSLRTHRAACEKCGAKPTHLLPKKRRRKLEEFEEEDGSLGGLLRW